MFGAEAREQGVMTAQWRIYEIGALKNILFVCLPKLDRPS